MVDMEDVAKYSKDLKVLYVEDNKEERDLTVEILENFFSDITVATNGEEGFEKFQNSDFDLVLTDINMPKVDGITLTRMIREIDKRVPIVIITAYNQTDFLINSIDLGVSNYILKPFELEQFMLAIKKVSNKLTDEKERNRLISEKIHYDFLTKLYNRRYFNEVANNYFKSSMRKKESLCVIMIDIDNFKKINDIYGHLVGDEVLKELSSKMKQSVRSSDILARFGGEEFVILLPDTEQSGAVELAEKLRKEAHDIKIETKSKGVITFTISLGISCLKHNEDSSIEDILKRADTALYDAKFSGKDRVKIEY